MCVCVCGGGGGGGPLPSGVVVVYPMGDWYGFVSRESIEVLVHNYIEHGQLVRELWRGRMVREQRENREQRTENRTHSHTFN